MDNKYQEILESVKARYNMRLGEKNRIEADIVKATTTIDGLNKLIITQNQVIDLLQKTAEGARDKARQHLETVVTSALQYISGESYEFQIEITEKAGKPHAEFYVVTKIGGIESKQKPQEACGGGFVDIISAALRYAYLELYNKPNIQGGTLLDEPGKMVSSEASVRFAEFIKQLGVSFNRQTIMITHNDNLQNIADTTFVVALDSNGISKVTEGLPSLSSEDLDFEFEV